MQSHFAIPSHLRDVEARKYVVRNWYNKLPELCTSVGFFYCGADLANLLCSLSTTSLNYMIPFGLSAAARFVLPSLLFC